VIDLSCFRGQTMAVMGLGRSGMTAALALRESGVASHVWDDSANRRAEAEQSGLSLLDPADTAWDGIDALVLSPGIPHTFPKPHPAATAARAAGCRIISDIELLARARPDARYVGVTGTNGKSTTTSLIGHLLTRAGRTVAVGGNLGEPVLALDALDNDGIYVLELSSYQANFRGPDGRTDCDRRQRRRDLGEPGRDAPQRNTVACRSHIRKPARHGRRLRDRPGPV
jgi:UDP-N-acetylmuramoylalanine--D-glutamate ligase